MKASKTHNLSTNRSESSVETSKLFDLGSYFSTASTYLSTLSVGRKIADNRLNAKEIKEIPRFPRVPQEKMEELKFIFAWFEIALGEGHVEPSQPQAGRKIGWPQRPFRKESLWIDFEIWCKRTHFITPSAELFFSIADQVFEGKEEKYHFPSLPLCRVRFENVRRLNGFN